MQLQHVVTDEYASSNVREILAAPVTALRGVTADGAEALRAAFKIETVESLGKNLLFRFAQAMNVMGGVKNEAEHSDWGNKPLRDALDEPPTVIKYISPEQATTLENALGITTIREMGTNPVFLRAQGLLQLNEPMS